VNVRVTCVEPGFVDTELQGHNTIPMVVEATQKMREQVGKVLDAEDIAQAILYAVSQPEHVSINEVLVRPTGQTR
jgi:NADP-dependent 3-hydroxy acid dehydrogenase YdfG